MAPIFIQGFYSRLNHLRSNFLIFLKSRHFPALVGLSGI